MLRQIMDQLNFKQLSKKNKVIVVVLIIIIFGLFFLIINRSWEANSFISPINENSLFEFISTKDNNHYSNETGNKIVYGFLPYWNVNQLAIQPELTHLSYFGLNINADGTLLTKTEDGNLHPGYNKFTSDEFWELAQNLNEDQKIEIVLVQFDPDKITKLVNSPEAHQNLLTAIDSLLLAYPVHGINIDIEYGGTITSELRDNYALLIETIDQHLDQKFSHVQLSIDVYASASNNKQIWDIPRLAKSIDYLVVMAYDFHRRSSLKAGPVAPLFSDNDYWSDNIHQNLREFLKYIPQEKILLGIPFYGYEWQVDEWSAQANTYPDTGMTASYERVKELLNNPNLQIETGWDEQALCPYLTYLEDDKIHVIYYENPTSIEYKLEYVKQLNLGGIAIWALGYEGDDRDLWNVIESL